ncbi:Glutamate Receptor Ionotropic, Kainate 3 [Manis pentadactyla]|nr:Glutamate Receptor Ionotropic, Kainate 3 [Manis pentadactyla]
MQVNGGCHHQTFWNRLRPTGWERTAGVLCQLCSPLSQGIPSLRRKFPGKEANYCGSADTTVLDSDSLEEAGRKKTDLQVSSDVKPSS